MGKKLLKGSGNMGTCRLCNTSYTEFTVNLPLPHLPISFGANSRELRLVEEGDGVSRVRTTKSSKILSEAGKIAELLKAADVSYLSLRDDAKNEAALFSRNPASLLAAVLKHDPEAFKFSSSGPSKQRDCQISPSDRSCQQNEHGNIALQNNHAGPVVDSLQDVSMDVRTPVSAIKSRIRRKNTNEKRIDEGRLTSSVVDLKHDKSVGNLCEILEELFDRTEMTGEEDSEEGGTWMPFSSIKHLSEELMAEESKNTLHLVPVGHIVKLLDVLNRNILQAITRAVNDEDDIRCTDSAVCTKSGVKVVVTEFTDDNRTDFLLYFHTFESLARPGKIHQLLNMVPGLDVEYKRIPCDYPGKNMSIKVDKSSHYLDYLAVRFLYQRGQTDISLVQVSQVGHWSWREMSLRNYSAVWGIANPYSLTGHVEPSPLLFRLLVTGGFDGSWVGRPGYNLLPGKLGLFTTQDFRSQRGHKNLTAVRAQLATGTIIYSFVVLLVAVSVRT